MFSSRERIRRWKSLSGVLHLVTVSCLVLSVVWILPRLDGKSPLQIGQEVQRQIERRQLLIEALDKMARYEKYYGEIHGRYTRDLSRLPLPERLASGHLANLERDYELSVLETRPNRFILLATGISNSDRVTIDEGHRLNANFVLPAPSRAYLREEADRMLRLRAHGLAVGEGLYVRFWEVSADESQAWVAVGVRNPVIGEKREGGLEETSLFATVREKMQGRVTDDSGGRGLATVEAPGAYKQVLESRDVNEWLEAARLAQHIHLRERGRFARRWEELDTVSNYHFADRSKAVKNLRVHPVEMTKEGFQLTLEGTSGELMGEQFTINREGQVRQVRYTETLIHQLEQTTNILESFQINPIVEEPAERP